MNTDISELKPQVADAARSALADLDKRGIPHSVTCTIRTYSEQRALYAQGREDLLTVNSLRHEAGLPAIGQDDNAYVVTQLNGLPLVQGGKGRSPHQMGIALDVVPKGPNGPEWPPATDQRWIEISKSFKSQGFEWGGDWKDFVDLPHYQMSV
jgi:peptidoglycan L-alanyl-D-glutamate endopeptidase CwlK